MRIVEMPKNPFQTLQEHFGSFRFGWAVGPHASLGTLEYTPKEKDLVKVHDQCFKLKAIGTSQAKGYREGKI